MNRSDSEKTLIQPVMSALNGEGKPTSVDVLSYFVSAASQQIATPTNVNRSDTFLIGNEHFEASDNWAAVFCKTEDLRRCTAAMIAITESKSAREELPNGQLVPMLTYISGPG
jgi:hypothetical protein